MSNPEATWLNELSENQLPADDVAATLRDLSLRLRREFENQGVEGKGAAETGQTAWQAWQTISPVPTRVNDSLEKRALEVTLDGNEPDDQGLLVHLQEVCRQPHFRLESRVERQPVHRARNISRGAIAHLAAHPEDWEQRKLRTIRPSHVLARRNQLNLNVYENRVAARLIDDLLSFLSRRIAELRRLEELCEDARAFSEHIRGTFRLQHRVTSIWGESIDAEEMVLRIQERLEELNRLMVRVARLRESSLYRAVPRGAEVGEQLQATNVLRDDQHYRFVAKLWRASVKAGNRQRETTDERRARRAKLKRAYSDFVTLLMTRCLEEFGWRSADGDIPTEGASVQLRSTHREGTIELTRSSAGHLRLHLDAPHLESPDLVVLAAPVLLSKLGSHELEALSPSVGLRDDNPPRLLAHLGQEQSGSPSDSGALVDPLRLSPFDLNSQERLATALNGWLLRPLWSAYPLEHRAPSRLRRVLPDVSWLENEGRGLRVTSPPPESAVASVIENLRKSARREIQRSPNGDNLMEHVEELDSWLHSGVVHFKQLCFCPVCREDTKADRHHFQARDEATFRNHCDQCDSSWGLNICGDCKQRYAFLKVDAPPNSALKAALSATDEPVVEDWQHHLGRDMLAEPHPAPEKWGQFTCPHCDRP